MGALEKRKVFSMTYRSRDQVVEVATNASIRVRPFHDLACFLHYAAHKKFFFLSIAHTTYMSYFLDLLAQRTSLQLKRTNELPLMSTNSRGFYPKNLTPIINPK